MKHKNSQPHMMNNLLVIERAIRSGNYPNATTLSKLIEKSPKTVSRYIDVLRDDYQAPIEFDFHKNGYYYTDNNFFIQNVMLKESELLSISAIIPMLEQFKRPCGRLKVIEKVNGVEINNTETERDNSNGYER